MTLSRTWLARHLDLYGLTDADLEDALVRLGVEVDAVTRSAVPAEQLVVARILEAEVHPNADRLKVCQVDAGESELRQIVCGAKNYRIGDYVPCALPGCQLAPDFRIEVGKLRGVESRGMLCAASEIGLEDDEDGLMILPGEPQPGTPLIKLFPAETIFELEVTPNRPDCLSHRGLARELSAWFGRPLLTHNLPTPEDITTAEHVEVADFEACPLYTLRRFSGLKNGPSPDWIARSLRAIGIQPRNALVDITNLLLHDIGQPLHVFDTAKLNGPLQVRRALPGETFTALDQECYQLVEDDLVIADERGPVALAGVMGGLESGVSATTTEVWLESAYFDPAFVRRTSRRLGLISDSSLQFERGADPETACRGSELATRLILEFCGGRTKGPLEIAGEVPPVPGPIELRGSQVLSLLGCALPTERISGILESLGLETSGPESWTIPSWRRADLQRPVDLIEEISRFHGIDEIESRHAAEAVDPSPADRLALAADALRDELVARGFFECRTLKLCGVGKPLQGVGTGQPRALKNPLSADLDHLRGGLVPGLLAVVERNEAQLHHRHACFEIGTVFRAGEFTHPATIQSQRLALLLAGARQPADWTEPAPRPATIHDLRGEIEVLLPAGTRLKAKPADIPGTVCAVSLQVGKTRLGWIGILDPARQREIDCPEVVLLAELELEPILQLREKPVRYQAPPRFPATARDLALEADLDLPAQQVQAFFNGLNQPLIESVELFDHFHDPSGERLPANRKSLAWRVTYRSPERTLEASEVEAIHTDIRTRIEKQLPVKLR